MPTEMTKPTLTQLFPPPYSEGIPITSLVELMEQLRLIHPQAVLLSLLSKKLLLQITEQIQVGMIHLVTGKPFLASLHFLHPIGSSTDKWAEVLEVGRQGLDLKYPGQAQQH